MTDQNNLSTAHQEWDKRWAGADHLSRWVEPEPMVIDLVPILNAHGIRDILDIGCGMGRNAVYLAQQGFSVTGLDASQAGLESARKAAEAAGVDIALHQGDFTQLPFDDQRFDLAISWNVLYHGDGDIARTAFAEIHRILRPGGLLLATMISQRHRRYGEGREIRPYTFIIDADEEKAHAHFYVNDRLLLDQLDGFQIIRLEDRDQQGNGEYHWEFLVERK